MSWKKYKEVFLNEYPDESKFILGIDLGNKFSTITYFDINKKTSEVIDISGGYGKPGLPSVLQYSSENNEWIFGEYAILNNSEKDKKIEFLVDNLGQNKFYDINNQIVNFHNILGIYLEELIENCKNINPNGIIVGIVISVPNYSEDFIIDEIKLAMKSINMDKYIIEYAEARKCILTNHFFENDFKEENILVLDYSNSEIRGSIYKNYKNEKEENILECLASALDKTVSEQNIEDIIKNMMIKNIFEETKKTFEDLNSFEKEQLNYFLYQNKDLLFQKNTSKKNIKLYYNFIHPPFQKEISFQEVLELIKNIKKNFTDFIIELFNKNIDANSNINIKNIDKVICTGGGFEMYWAEEICNKLFNKDKLLFYRNSKTVISEGAAILAASKLGIIKEIDFTIIDNNLIENDIGINIVRNNKEQFFSILERKIFWWYKPTPKIFLVNYNIDENLNLEFFLRDKESNLKLLKILDLKDFPMKEKGTTKLKISVFHNKYKSLTITVEDFGFGEIFPKSNYKKRFTCIY